MAMFSEDAYMSFMQKFLLPKKLLTAAYILMVTLIVAIGYEYFTDFETARFVKTVIIYLLLDYAWATIKREWTGEEPKF